MSVSGYALADHVSSTTVRNALQTNALEERVPDYINRWHNHILRKASSRFIPKVSEFPTRRKRKC
jgi:hypothetical protein